MLVQSKWVNHDQKLLIMKKTFLSTFLHVFSLSCTKNFVVRKLGIPFFKDKRFRTKFATPFHPTGLTATYSGTDSNFLATTMTPIHVYILFIYIRYIFCWLCPLIVGYEWWVWLVRMKGGYDWWVGLVGVIGGYDVMMPSSTHFMSYLLWGLSLF